MTAKLREALREIAGMTYDSWTNGAKAQEIAERALAWAAPADHPAPEAWRGLLKEARDNCEASIAEDGISATRRDYRKELLTRLDAALASPPEQAEPAAPSTSPAAAAEQSYPAVDPLTGEANGPQCCGGREGCDVREFCARTDTRPNAAWIDRVIRDVAELPDRNSPEGWPEAMLVTADELRAIIGAALASPPEQARVPRATFDKFLRCWEYGGALRMPDIWEAYQAGWIDCERPHPANTQLEPLAQEGGQGERATLLRVIQRLNQNPYSLTKSECIDVVLEMMAAAAPAYCQHTEAASSASPAEAPAGSEEFGDPRRAMTEVELQEFCIALSFEQDDYTVEVIRSVENRMLAKPLFVPAAHPQPVAPAGQADDWCVKCHVHGHQAANCEAPAGQAAAGVQGDVPDGYMLVMVPKLQPHDEPDWEECIRQAEVATGLKVERNTLSIVIREVRRWLAGRSAGVRGEDAFLDSPFNACMYREQCKALIRPAPAVERGVAEELPTAFDYAASKQMAVTREWCRGWDDARAALSPAGKEQA